MPTITAQTHINPAGYDHDRLTFHDADTGATLGHGFISRPERDIIGLTRCPECKRENYSLNVLTGACSWCGFDAKPLFTPTTLQS